MSRRKDADDVLGNRALTHFDFCIIGSGAGGGAAAHVLTAGGKTVLVLEAGDNPFPGLDQKGPLPPPLHSNDELKYEVRDFIDPFGDLEPRTFRKTSATDAVIHPDVNLLPKCVGGAFSTPTCKTPRFTAVDFQLVTAMQRAERPQSGARRAGLRRRRGERQLRRLALHLRRPRAVLRRGRAALSGWRATTPTRSRRRARRRTRCRRRRPMYLARILRDGASRTTFLGGPLTRTRTRPRSPRASTRG